MKNLYFIALCTAFTLNAQVTSFPWIETFEDDSPTRADWTQINEVETMNWDYASTPATGSYIGPESSESAYEGTLFAHYAANSHAGDITKLVSPVLNLDGAENVTLSFYYRNPFWDPDQNTLRIYYRVSETDDWVLLQTFDTDVQEWTLVSGISLPNPSATYQIALEAETEYGFSIGVDLLTVEAETLSVQDISTTQRAELYPNPTSDVLNISKNSEISQIEVFNLTGKKVKEFKANAKDLEVNVSDLTKGVYFIRIKSKKGVETQKFIKK